MADAKKAAVYFKDTAGDSFYSTFTGLNPAAGSTAISSLASAVSELTDGDLVKTVVTDTTTIFPEAGE